jgi:hypothetical protein
MLFPQQNTVLVGFMLVFCLSNVIKASWNTTAIAIIGEFSDVPYFGSSLASSVDTIIVGAGGGFSNAPGQAFVFQHDGPSFNRSDAVVRLSEAPHRGQFGRSVAICGNSMVVGAYANRTVYIYNRPDASAAWNVASPTVIDGYASEVDFGYVVAISDDYILVSSPGLGSNKAFIFGKRNDTGAWNTTAIAVIDGYSYVQHFGYSLSIEGRFAFIGCNLVSKIYVFELHPDTLRWNTTAVIVLDGQYLNQYFANSIATSGDTLIATQVSPRVVYIFVRRTDQTVGSGGWSVVPAVTINAYTSVTGFGSSVAISGNEAFVGSLGKVFVFQRIDGAWSSRAHLVFDYSASDTMFGSAVAVAGRLAAISSFSVDGPKRLYIFANSCPQGSVFDATVDGCSECPAGSYVSSAQSTVRETCTLCPPGSFSAVAASVGCKICTSAFLPGSTTCPSLWMSSAEQTAVRHLPLLFPMLLTMFILTM